MKLGFSKCQKRRLTGEIYDPAAKLSVIMHRAFQHKYNEICTTFLSRTSNSNYMLSSRCCIDCHLTNGQMIQVQKVVAIEHLGRDGISQLDKGECVRMAHEIGTRKTKILGGSNDQRKQGS